MRLPLTVIGGYLGAGKTTLINRLLAEDHGLRLLVMVNDFGAINVDAALLSSASDDTVELTNGCVCCTMGADLYMAIGDVLDRPRRPDHLVIEASGIADPARIAHAALTEPELAYAGVVTVVDGLAWPALSSDPQIGAQVRGQVAAAETVILTKTAERPEGMEQALLSGQLTDLATPVLGLRPDQTPAADLLPHPGYTHWQTDKGPCLNPADLRAVLDARPIGMFRVKGWLPAPKGKTWEVHCVGPTTDIKPSPSTEIGLVGIGPSDRFRPMEADTWWRAACGT